MNNRLLAFLTLPPVRKTIYVILFVPVCTALICMWMVSSITRIFSRIWKRIAR
jgi:hypothetical protein